MTTFRVLDQLEGAIRHSFRFPLTGIILIDGERLLSIIDRVRTSLPEELNQARYLTQESQRILREAHEKAEAILAEAAEQANQRVSHTEVMKTAKEQAEELSTRSAAAAKEMRDSAETYAREVLSGLETELERLAHIVKNGKGKLGAPSESPTPAEFAI